VTARIVLQHSFIEHLHAILKTYYDSMLMLYIEKYSQLCAIRISNFWSKRSFGFFWIYLFGI